MLRSWPISKQSGKSVESVLKKKGRLRWEGFVEKESFQHERMRVMNDESGESMEPMDEVALIRLGESEMERLVRG